MKRTVNLLALLLTLTVLCGCGKIGRPAGLTQIYDLSFKPVVNNSDSAEKLLTKEVDIHDFVPNMQRQIYDYVEMVDRYIGVECLRRTEGNALYSLHKVKQGGYLYLFYYPAKPEYMNQTSVADWFYVRKPLSYQDFAGLQLKKSTMEDVLAIDDTVQIYKNLYQADPAEMCIEQEGNRWFWSRHYLTDGILTIVYKVMEDKLIIDKMDLSKEYLVCDSYTGFSFTPDHNGKILDMDRLYESGGDLTADYSQTSDYEVNNTDAWQRLVTKELDIHAFAESYAMGKLGANYHYDKLHYEFGIECFREPTEEGWQPYAVYKVKQGGLLYFFDYFGVFYVTKPLQAADFEGITAGADIQDVMAVDCAAQLTKNMYDSLKSSGGWMESHQYEEDGVMKTERDIIEWKSQHYLKDGILTITYEEQNGSLKVADKKLASDFIVSKSTGACARILDIDQI